MYVMMEKGELLQLHCAQALHCVHLPSPLHCASIDLGAGWPSHQSGGADQQYRTLLGIKQALASSNRISPGILDGLYHQQHCKVLCTYPLH